MRTIAVGLMASMLFSATAMAETLTVPFTMPNGGTTADEYDGTVRITVSGYGKSDASYTNDAFYLFTGNSTFTDSDYNMGYYQLAFGTSPLSGYTPSNAIKNDLVDGVPAYKSSHDYSFLINTGLASPGKLYFGVTDGQYGDNSGAFNISVSAVPEPSTWAMILVGFAGLGFAAHRRATRQRSVGFSAA